MNQKITKSFYNLLENVQGILVVVAPNAAIDDWCAAYAMRYFAEKKGLKATILSPDLAPQNIKFLDQEEARNSISHMGDVKITLSIGTDVFETADTVVYNHSTEIFLRSTTSTPKVTDVKIETQFADFDLIITFGLKALKDLGPLYQSHPEIFTQIPIINVRQQLDGDNFGVLRVFKPEKASVSECVFDLITSESEFKIDQTLANILMTGVMAGTDSFMDYRTGASAFNLASQLQKAGANHSDIVEYLFKQKSHKTLKLWGEVLKNLEVDEHLRLAWSEVSARMLENLEVTVEDLDSISHDLLRFVDNVDVSLLALEGQPGLIQVRSSLPEYDFEAVVINENIIEVKDGFNLASEADFGELEKHSLFQRLVKKQAERYQLSGLSLNKKIVQIETVPEQKPVRALVSQKSVKASAPSLVPFDAPKKETSEKPKSEIKLELKVNESSEAKLTENPENGGSKKPSWLKRS